MQGILYALFSLVPGAKIRPGQPGILPGQKCSMPKTFICVHLWVKMMIVDLRKIREICG
jgi:hypothetical protein